MDNKEIEKELDRLESALTLLKRDFEVFFSGASKLPPYDSQKKLEKTILKYSRMAEMTYAQRFRYNSLTARFNTYMDLWTKQMRAKEEGRTPSGGFLTTQELKKKPVAPAVPEPDSREKKLEAIYKEYVRAREQTGEGNSTLSLEKFRALLMKQQEAIVNKYHCKDVDFYVAIDQGHAKLKARPIK